MAGEAYIDCRKQFGVVASDGAKRNRGRWRESGVDCLRGILDFISLHRGYACYGRHKQFTAFVERLKASGKAPKTIVVALMRKILTIAQAVLKSQTPFNPAFHAS